MTDTKPVVYIVEDDRAFCRSIVRLLRTAGYQAVSFETANSFLALENIDHPACLLLDICLPDFDGIELQQRLSEQGKIIPIVFMTGHGDIPMSVKAMKKGAVDFLPKPFKPEEFLGAINEALSRDMHQHSVEAKKNEVLARIETLTPREFEVMRWVITGMLNKQIADELNISEKTVKVHRGRVMQKMCVWSVAELVRMAQLADIAPASDRPPDSPRTIEP